MNQNYQSYAQLQSDKAKFNFKISNSINFLLTPYSFRKPDRCSFFFFFISEVGGGGGRKEFFGTWSMTQTSANKNKEIPCLNELLSWSRI